MVNDWENLSFNVKPETIGLFYGAPHSSWPGMKFNDFDLWIAMSGWSLVEIERVEYELHQGHILLLPPGAELAQKTREKDCEIVNLHFDLMLNGAILKEHELHLDPQHPTLELTGIPPLGIIAKADTQKSASAWLHIRHQLGNDLAQLDAQILLLDALRACRATYLQQTRDLSEKSALQRVEEVVWYIQQELSSDLSLERLAERASMSPTHLRRLFSKFYHASPSQVVTRIRMTHARDLLYNPRFKISDIAKLCGYSTLQLFSRVFTQHYGKNPSTYRRQLMEERRV